MSPLIGTKLEDSLAGRGLHKYILAVSETHKGHIDYLALKSNECTAASQFVFLSFL